MGYELLGYVAPKVLVVAAFVEVGEVSHQGEEYSHFIANLMAIDGPVTQGGQGIEVGWRHDSVHQVPQLFASDASLGGFDVNQARTFPEYELKPGMLLDLYLSVAIDPSQPMDPEDKALWTASICWDGQLRRLHQAMCPFTLAPIGRVMWERYGEAVPPASLQYAQVRVKGCDPQGITKLNDGRIDGWECVDPGTGGFIVQRAAVAP